MNITVNGKIRYIGEDQEVSGDKGNHQFKIIIIETLDNSYLAIHAWDEAMEKVNEIKIGEIVELNCRLESHRNKKNRDLWYHKLLLK
jgi:hypothetical protein